MSNSAKQLIVNAKDVEQSITLPAADAQVRLWFLHQYSHHAPFIISIEQLESKVP